jgi:ankyrin repeat protein
MKAFEKHSSSSGPNHNEEAFLEAASVGDIFRVKSFIDKRVNINTKNREGLTALTLSAFNGHLEVL